MKEFFLWIMQAKFFTAWNSPDDFERGRHPGENRGPEIL